MAGLLVTSTLEMLVRLCRLEPFGEEVEVAGLLSLLGEVAGLLSLRGEWGGLLSLRGEKAGNLSLLLSVLPPHTSVLLCPAPFCKDLLCFNI